jgi:hypothetical protein
MYIYSNITLKTKNGFITNDRHKLKSFCRFFLKRDEQYPVTLNDVNEVRALIFKMLHEENLSPTQIKTKLNYQHSDFNTFIRVVLKLKTKSWSDAIKNYNKQIGRAQTDKKQLYKTQCQFSFNRKTQKQIPGYNLLEKHGVYHPILNKNGACRDHIISIEFGWRNNISPEIISHPANCQFLLNDANIKKGSAAWLTVEQLNERIKNWGEDLHLDIITTTQLTKTESHKRKISKSLKDRIRITNGKVTKTLPFGAEIPEGFWRGLTRKI